MSRLTLRLPDSLHQNLSQQAKTEGVSLNQMIVYLLARVTTAADLGNQQSAFNALLHRYPATEAEEALQEVLAARTEG
jgi:hypothetical protein